MVNAIIGDNIRALREDHGETQKQLAKALSVSVSTVSAWELGTRSVPHDAIQAIASRYTVTVDSLLSFDDHDTGRVRYPSSKDELDDIKAHLVYFVTTPEAMEDEEFREAYRNLQVLRTTPIEDLADPYKYVTDTEEHLRKSVVENETVESACNWVALVIHIWIEYVLPPEDLRKEFKNLPGQAIGAFTKKVMRNHNLFFTPETEEKRRLFLEDRLVVMKMLIKMMKRSEDWADLADYYTAMRYLYGMVKNPNSAAENNLIGSYMMNEFRVSGNEYAEDFVKSVLGTFFEETNT